MTDSKIKVRRKLSREILGLLVLTFMLTLFLFQVLGLVTGAMIDQYLFARDILLNNVQYTQIDAWGFNLRLIISAAFFMILFLFLLGERLSYIREILSGIDALRGGLEDYFVPLEGSNELTQLAEAVNYLSRNQREVKERERILNEEKEQFIRSMSHDIRTPLTSILSYCELMIGERSTMTGEQFRYLKLIQNKAVQIREMTNILLEGSKRNLEYFEDIRLLVRQLEEEFEETLEDQFVIETILDCPAFSATLDVQELRRILDNLISNVQKYADPSIPVKLSVSMKDTQLIIQQKNAVRKLEEPAEGYQIGMQILRRIVQNYKGRVEVQKDEREFSITLSLSMI